MRYLFGRGRAIGVVLCVLAALAAAPASAKERLTIGISQFPSTLHPAFDSMLAKSYTIALARRPITAYGPDWKVRCLLCVALPDLADGSAVHETAENGEPGIAVTFELDSKAVWGDGTPITVKDAILAWEIGGNPQSGIDSAELYRRIDRIDAHSDKRFTLHFNKRTCDYRNIAGLTLLPDHIERAIYEGGEAATYRQRTAYDTDPGNAGLWFGPYRVARVTAPREILLVRNEAWWGKAPAFDEILIKVVENTAALSANILSGDIDMIAGELGLNIDQALSFEKSHGDRFQMIFRPGLIYEHLDVNLDSPILSDPLVRRALILGADRDAISTRLFEGKQPVADSNVNPLDSVFASEVPRHEHDPAAAAALLEQAGWLMGPDGIRVKNGAPLTFELMTTAGNKTRELVQQVLQSQWREIGVRATIRNEPAQVFFGETVSKRKFDGLALFAWISAPESIPRTTLHSEMIPTKENGWTGQNYTGYASPEMDRTIDELEVKCNADDQTRLWTELQIRYATDLPAIPLYFRANTFILPKQLEGLVPTGHQYPSTLWVEDWRWEGE